MLGRVPAKICFDSYGAVCHGKDAKGNGPAATTMKTPPADLTTLAKGNGGKHPASHVAAVIRGQNALASHGTPDMPIGGRCSRALVRDTKPGLSCESRTATLTALQAR